MLITKSLSVVYPNGVLAFQNANLSFKKGKVYGIIGPSGSGKSSLLKAILKLVPYSGEVSYMGSSIEHFAKKTAYIEQKEDIDRDFPITVLQCVMLGTYPRVGLFKRPKKKERKLAKEALATVGMSDFNNRQIGELSGGQFQRVLIARALAQNADLLLMDEPFVGIDIKNEAELIEQLKNMAQEGKTILVVHHDLSKAKDYFDEIVIINKEIIAAGSTEKVLTLENIEKAYNVLIPALDKVTEQNRFF